MAILIANIGETVQAKLLDLQQQIDDIKNIPNPVTISIDPIGGDGDITIVEAAAVTISGVTTAVNGSTVSLDIDNNSLGSATVLDGIWSLTDIDITVYANDGSHLITASVSNVSATTEVYIHSAPAFGPLPEIDTVWFYDASRGVGMIGGYETIASDYMLEKHGLTLTFVNKSVSGQTPTQIISRWEAEKASVEGHSNLLIVTTPIGNAIDGGWDTRTETFRNGLITQYSEFIDSIQANGNIVMPGNTSFRNYNQTTVNMENNGSLLYNLNVVWPKVQNIVPSMWEDGSPYLDSYNLNRNWYETLLADPVHSTLQGYHLDLRYHLDTIAARIKGEPAPRIQRVVDPTLNQTPPIQPAIIQFSAGGAFSKSTSVFWAMQKGHSFVGSGRLLSLDGYDPNRIVFVSTAFEGGGNNAGSFNTGNKSKSLLNDGIKNSFIQTTSQVFVEVGKFTGLEPGQAVTIDLLSCRAAAGATNRYGLFSIDGGATVVEANGAYTAPAIPTLTTLTGTANSLGELPLSMRCKFGSSFAYLNGAYIEPLSARLTIDPVGGDGDITSAESESVIISGTSNASNGTTVTLAIDGVALSTTSVVAGAWELNGVDLSAYANDAQHIISAVVGTIRTTAKVIIRSENTTEYTPLTGITRLAVVGTSLEYGIVNNHTTTMKNYFASKHGLTIDVTNYGYTGATIEVIANNWNNTIKPALTGRTDTVVMINALPNTITNNVPYANANPTVIAQEKTRWDNLIADIRTTVGADKVIVMGNMFRDFAPANSCITNEELGVVPFDRNFIWPQSEIDGRMYLGEAWGAPYNFGFNWTTQVQYDGTHYTVPGYGMLCMYYCDTAASFIKGTLPPRIPKKVDPITDTKPRSARVMIDYSNNGNIERSLYLGATLRGSTVTTAVPSLSPHDTYEPSLGLGARPQLSSGSQTSLATGDTSRTITNDLLRVGYQFTTSMTWVLMEPLTNLNPGQVVDLEIMGGRATTGLQVAEYSFDQSTIVGELDTACVVGQVPKTIKLVGTADANGILNIYFRRKAGQNTTAAYVLAMDVFPR